MSKLTYCQKQNCKYLPNIIRCIPIYIAFFIILSGYILPKIRNKMNLKLIEVLSSFSEGEWKKLENFVVFHENETSRNYTCILKEIKNRKDNGHDLHKINDLQLFQAAYKKVNLSYQTINNRQSELLNLCKSFLVENSFRKNELLKDVLFSSELLSRKLIKNYKSFLHKKNKLSEINAFNEESYKYLKELTLDEAAFYQLTKEDSNKINVTYKNYSDYILAEILNNLIKTGTELLMLKRVFHEKFNADYFMEVLKSLYSSGYFKKLEQSSNKIFLLPLIHFYIFESENTSNGLDYIRSAERIYFENEHLFAAEFKMEIYRKFMSYYTNKINSGEKQYRINIHNLIRRKLNQNLTEDLQRAAGYNIFREYVINGIQLKKYKWVENLISSYSHLLPSNIKEIVIATSLMRLAFARGDFNKVLVISQNKKNIDLIYYIDISLYRLMAFYELNKFDEAYNEITMIKRHLKNQTDILGAFDKVKLFLKTYRKLLNTKINTGSDRNYFLFLIEKEKTTYMLKDWIIEKAQQLIKDI